MAKRKRSATPARPQGPRQPPSRRLRPPRSIAWTSILPLLLAAGLAAVPFGLWKYYEFTTNGAFDGGLNVYTAQCLVNGQKIGVDISPNARPATLLVNVVGVTLFGFSELGPKLIQMLCQLGALGMMVYTLRKLYGVWPAAAALLLTAFYLSCPPYAKFGNVKEQFMIAYMVIGACAFILRYLHGQRGWLLLSGAMAINAYYFKATGISLGAALLVYLLLQSLLRRYHWRHMMVDLLWLFGGAVLGLIPLGLFHLWQGQFGAFINRFPASVITYILGLMLLSAAVYTLLRLAARYRVGKQMKQVRLELWIVGGLLIGLALAGFLVYYRVRFPDQPGQWRYLLGDDIIPFRAIKRLGLFLLSFRQIIWNVKAIFSDAHVYISGSRAVTDLASQFKNVLMYYQSFVVPIGLALWAIGWRIGRVYASLSARKKSTTASSIEPTESGRDMEADRFVLFLALWWLLDMAFVWISPRSYVEYFLPLNASAAMLGAYAIYRCQNRPAGFLGLLVLWMAVDFLLRTLAPSGSFPYLALRDWAAVKAALKLYQLMLLPLAVGGALLFATRRRDLRPVRLIVLPVIVLGVACWWNTANFAGIHKRIGDHRQLRRLNVRYPWEQVADYIRTHSKPEDGLYVWGWYPGLYVQAQRFSPSRHPTYGDMHTDPPDVVREKIGALVEELQARPPKFIVDSQKVHFPFGDHPVFSLWPRWVDKSKGRFYFRYHRSQELKHRDLLTVDKIRAAQEAYEAQVERISYALMTHAKRAGGPLDKDTAKTHALRERQRHHAMVPLRDFVMTHYLPIQVSPSMHVFERQ